MVRILSMIFLMMTAIATTVLQASVSRNDDLWKSPKPTLRPLHESRVTITPSSNDVLRAEASYSIVSQEVTNLRCLLGGGRKIIRHECEGHDIPAIDVVFTRDVDRPEMRLFEALSMDNGETWSRAGPLTSQGMENNRDRNHIVDWNNMLSYILYNEQDGNPVSGLSEILLSQDLYMCLQAFNPFTSITTIDSLNEFYPMLSMVEPYTAYLSFIDFDNGNPYTTYVRRSLNNGQNWSPYLNITATIGTDGFDMDGMDGSLMIDAEDDFIGALAMVVLDPAFASANGFLPNVTYPAYTQSTDGGVTWDALRLVFGNAGSQYPRGHSGNQDLDAVIHYIGGVNDAIYTAFNNCQDNVALTTDGLVHLTFTMRDTTVGYRGVWHVLVDNGMITPEYIGFPENIDIEGESGVAYMSSIAKADEGHIAVGWTEFIQGSGAGNGDICMHVIPAGELSGSGPVNVTDTQEEDETYQRIVDVLVPTSNFNEYFVDWLFLYYGEGGSAPDSTLWHLQTTAFIGPPPILINVDPDTTHYHRGESLGYTVEIINNMDSTIFIQGWSEGELPGGEIITPLAGPFDGVISAFDTISVHHTQPIPLYTPFGGPYFYRVKVGNYPDEILASDSFFFSIDPPVLGLEITPDSSHFYLGYEIGFTVTVTNMEDSTVNIEGWTEIDTPWGTTLSPLFEPVDVVLEAQQSTSEYMRHTLPDTFPVGGPYVYRASVGKYPNTRLAEDSFEFYITPLDIVVQAVPDTTHFHPGEHLGFTVTITNNSSVTVTAMGWSEGQGPAGSVFSPLLGPFELEIAPHSDISLPMSQQIPEDIMFGGPYLYRVLIGGYPDDVLTESFFEFDIVPYGKAPDEPPQ